jgi:hypothetical protein
MAGLCSRGVVIEWTKPLLCQLICAMIDLGLLTYSITLGRNNIDRECSARSDWSRSLQEFVGWGIKQKRHR